MSVTNFHDLRSVYQEIRPCAFHTLTKEELLDETPMDEFEARIKPLAKWLLAVGEEYQSRYSHGRGELRTKVTHLKEQGFASYLGPFFEEPQDEIFPTFSLLTAYFLEFSRNDSHQIDVEERGLFDLGRSLCQAMNHLENCFEEGEESEEINRSLKDFSQKFIDFIVEIGKHPQYRDDKTI